jgi:hypothetical protein
MDVDDIEFIWVLPFLRAPVPLGKELGHDIHHPYSEVRGGQDARHCPASMRLRYARAS